MIAMINWLLPLLLSYRCYQISFYSSEFRISGDWVCGKSCLPLTHFVLPQNFDWQVELFAWYEVITGNLCSPALASSIVTSVWIGVPYEKSNRVSHTTQKLGSDWLIINQCSPRGTSPSPCNTTWSFTAQAEEDGECDGANTATDERCI